MTAPRRRWIPWVTAAAVVIVCAGAAAYLVPPVIEHRSAERRYEAALAEYEQATSAWNSAQARWDEVSARADEGADVASALTPEAVRPYLDESQAAAVRDLLELIDGARADAAAGDAPEAVEADPDTTEELRAAADELEARTDAVGESAARVDDAAALVDDSLPDLDAAVEDLRASITERAAAIEEENISATAQSRIRLHYAAETAATSEDNVAYYVEAYAEAAAAVEQSQRDELAEKDQGDGLIDVRLEIEEFVRSITGGVRVDFDWAPIVNGLGDGESAGGRVTWQYLDGGSATMELSNSIAAHWPDPGYESLVAHESGHVITAKCQDMLTDDFDGDAELMATAWAIGMGYDDPWGNGVNFYYGGVAPEPELVEATTACR